jgi:hypothetical protein
VKAGRAISRPFLQGSEPLITDVRRQPALGLIHRYALAPCIVLLHENKFCALTAFNAYPEMGGTLVDADEDDGTILYAIIDKIMSMFQ